MIFKFRVKNFKYASRLREHAEPKYVVILGNSTPVGQLAVNETPYFNFLKKNNLDKGIL